MITRSTPIVYSRKRRFRRKRKYRIISAGSSQEYADRNALLLELGYTDYKEYLKSDLWKGIRQRKIDIDYECFCCGRDENQAILQVHHGKYTRDNLLGNTLADLFTACKGCHQNAEVTRTGYKRSPAAATRELKRLRNIRLSQKHMARIQTVFTVFC